MNKLNLTLCALAALQIVILLVVKFTGDDPTGTDSPRSLLDLNMHRVAGIQVSNPDDEEEVSLKKKDGKWLLSSSDDYPVVGDHVMHEHQEGEADHSHSSEGLLDKLSDIEIRRAVIRSASNHEPVKVADDTYERRITLTDSDGDTLARLFVAGGSRGSSAYLRLEGEDEVYEVDSMTPWDVKSRSSSWVENSYVNLEVDDVKSFTATIGKDKKIFAFEKREQPKETKEADAPKEDGTVKPGEAVKPAEPETEMVWWLTSPVEAKAKKTEVEGLLRKVCKVNLSDIVGRKQPADGGLDVPAATYSIKMNDGTTAGLTIGTKAEDSSDFVIKSSGSEYYVKVSEWSIKDTLEPKLEDLREEAPKVETPKEEPPEEVTPKKEEAKKEN